MKYKFTKKQFEEAVSRSFSIAEVCRQLGIRPVGGNYKTVKAKLKTFGISTEHFTGQGWNVGLKFRPKPPKDLSLILIKDSEYRSTNTLKRRLFKEGIKEEKCEICGLTEWLGNPLQLELHHINGNNTDNRLENLQILCPNCHAQTEHYRGKNTQSALSEKREVEYRKFKEALTDNADGNLEPSLSNKEGAETRHDKPRVLKTKRYCKQCGKELNFHQKIYCSIECSHEAYSKRPSVMELLNAFKQYKSYLQVAKHYEVSDKAVHKWVRLYKIEDMVKE